MSNSNEYTATSGNLTAISPGLYAIDYVATAYGTAKIQFRINDAWWDALTMTGQTHDVITIPPGTTYRVNISGGTSPVVRVTELPWHRA